MEYRVVKVQRERNSAMVELENEVNRRIEEGWQPFGSMAVIHLSLDRRNDLILFQPMIKS